MSCVNAEALHAHLYAHPFCPDLARIVAVWHRLPEPIRRAIRAILDAAEATWSNPLETAAHDGRQGV
jgi:hypothetical protein